MHHLLEEYEVSKHELQESKLRLKVQEKRFEEAKKNLETYIMNKQIYLPYDKLLKLEGKITSGNFIIRYGDGYEKIVSNEFNNCLINKEGIIDNRYSNMYWKHIEDNKYQKIVSTCYSSEIEEVLGVYNLHIDNRLIEESKIEYLYNKISIIN